MKRPRSEVPDRGRFFFGGRPTRLHHRFRFPACKSHHQRSKVLAWQQSQHPTYFVLSQAVGTIIDGLIQKT